MNSTVKNIIVSIILAAITYVIIAFINDINSPMPASGPDILVLGIIFIAIFSTTFLPQGTNAIPESNSNTASETVSASHTETHADAGSDLDLETGTVKWFNIKKGFGFITRDQGDDVFVHYRNIQGKGRRTIAEGQKVQFVVIDGDKGLQADQVEAIKAETT